MRVGDILACRHVMDGGCGLPQKMTDKALQQTNRKRIATEQVFERERRRSRNVRRLKVALPVLAVLMAVALVAKSVIAQFGAVTIDLAGMSIDNGRLVMDNPRMAGYSGDDRPYELQADRATQALSDDDVVDLENIGAKVPIGVSDWATIAAPSGKLVKSEGKLRIDSPAVVKTTDGLVAHLESAVIDVNQGDLTTDQPVKIDLDKSRITADSMMVTDGGSLIVFEKRVKVQIESERIRTVSAGDANAQD